MPKEKSNSLVSSTKKLKKKQQKNDDLATLNIETLDDNNNDMTYIIKQYVVMITLTPIYVLFIKQEQNK